MRGLRCGAAAFVCLAILTTALALLAPLAQAEVLSAGNGIYTVNVDTENGLYAAITGPQHPVGELIDLLFGGGSPSSSFNSLHSYTSDTDYLLSEITKQSTVALGSSGFKTTYTLSEPEQRDDLEVVQTVRAVGSDFANSRVEVRTVLINTGAKAVQVGIRYVWDSEVNLDDGPTFQAEGPAGPVLLSEGSFPAPAFDYYRLEDNDESPSPPSFDVLGTVNGPAGSEARPPTLLQFASWPEVDATAFKYTTFPGRITASAAAHSNDSAVLYYWGDNAADAPTIEPGASYLASASMYLTRAGEGLPRETASPPPPPPPTPPAPTPTQPPLPAPQITAGPPQESAQSGAGFTFSGTPGGSFQCSLDGGRWAPCVSGQAYRHLTPGDHLFRVREALGGKTSAPASYRWTIDLPRKCVLRVARARVFVYKRKRKARLVIHYTSYKPARVKVSYRLAGKKGALQLGSAGTRFKRAGVFRLPERLTAKQMVKLRGAKRFTVGFQIPKTPRSCGRYYTKRLTIPRKVSHQTVWFQSDSRFAPGGEHPRRR